MKPTKKVWRPANRDARTYKQVVVQSPTMMLEENKEADMWWKKAYIGTSHNSLSIQEIEMRMFRDEMREFAVSKLDEEFFVITKEQEGNLVFLDEQDKRRLEPIFKHLQPWTMNKTVKRKANVELMGLPLHLFSHENIRKIGELWGEVMEISYIHNSFHMVALTICIQVNREISPSLTIISKNYEYTILVKELCNYQFTQRYEMQMMTSDPLNDETTPNLRHLNGGAAGRQFQEDCRRLENETEKDENEIEEAGESDPNVSIAMGNPKNEENVEDGFEDSFVSNTKCRVSSQEQSN